MRDIVFFLIFFPFVLLALRHPFIGLCAWVWTITAVPKNELFGFAAELRYAYFLALITVISMVINRDKLKTGLHSNLFFIMVLFLIQTAISNSMTMSYSFASWAVWNDFLKAIIFCGLILCLMTTKTRIHALLYAYVFGIGFNIVAEASKFVLTAGTYPFPGIKNSMMTDNNLFALAIIMSLPISLYLLSTSNRKFFKLGTLGISGASLVAVIGSFSRGGFVGLIIVMWETFWKSKYKLLMLFAGTVVLIAAISVSYSSWSSRMGTIENAAQDQSFMGRVTAWKLATLAAIDNPVFGVGQDSMQYGHVWAYYYRDINKFDFVSTYNTAIDNPKAAHSVYFQVLGDAGFVGLFLFLLLLFKGWRLSAYLSKNSGQDWIRRLSKAIKTSLIAYAVSASLLSMAYYDILYMLLAVLACLQRIDSKSKVETSVNI
ncbi:putative O-glycosylation ligase, exosortase A system-associated [Alteromonas macleodii]|jgi:probable O-glycosylation ligase (exosortase A-associated)|uniref:putative O-glycosylation ligase, exosortase A system-associated n=1 Tax=Alteromonas macleodii TaxID=28108 RepID=UPI0001AEBB06|nr:putative O-glycosylation ligase, exosortase A system-associated [Alteromonas macleodii]AFS38152.1 O-antigen polymerase [Alteromonas macleodii ATCC 27126]